MEKITKTIFLSNDGQEFETEDKCIKWENRKFFKELKQLTDEEIVGLLKKLIFMMTYAPNSDSVVGVYIKEENNYGNGFEFKVIINGCIEDDKEVITGSVQGCGDIEVVDFDWGSSIGFSIKGVYEYLDSIGFFKEYSTMQIDNPNITDDFILIKQFEIRCDK